MTLWGITFGEPTAFILAGIAPVAIAALHFYDKARRRHLTSRLGELPVISRVIASASPARRALKTTILAIAVPLVLLAVAQPQTEGHRAVELHGLDVVLAVDVSKSMLVDDAGTTALSTERKVEPSRLARARELAGAVLDGLPPGDRVAPVVFAGAASHFPLTEDHDVVWQAPEPKDKPLTGFLNDLGPGDLPPGSNLGEMLRVARCVLRSDLSEDLGCAKLGRRGHGGDPLTSSDSLDPPGKRDDDDSSAIEQKAERGKAIVVFTDGADADDGAMVGVRTARELGIAVFFVGVGTKEGGLVWDIDFLGKRTQVKHLRDGSTVTSKRDDDGMRKLADIGGDANRYIVADEKGEVNPQPILEALKAVNRGLATKRIKEMKQWYQPFLFAGLMLLVIEVAIGTRRRREFPEAR